MQQGVFHHGRMNAASGGHGARRPMGAAWAVLLTAVLATVLTTGGCGGEPDAAPVAITADVQYVLDKLHHGSREERGDALALLVADESLYAVAEPQLRALAGQESDLFLRERLIDGLGEMATARLWGLDQKRQYGIPRQAAATGYIMPPEPPEDDPTAQVLERLVHDNNPYVVAHARAARARIGVSRGTWGLVLALEDRDVYPEMADLSLQLLREVTGLHLTGAAKEWWALLTRSKVGERYVDLKFAERAASQGGL